MNDINLKKISSPIITGKVGVATTKNSGSKSIGTQTSFNDVLKQKIFSDLTFTKHAVNRANERDINISTNNMEKLNKAMQIAKDKGIDETLVLIDKNAFIISAKNNKVITAIGENDLKDNIITNIQGTVFV